jgi:hypothetical protein
MNLEIIRRSHHGSSADITVYNTGITTITKHTVERCGLKDKNILVAVDKDDKEARFFYLTVDPAKTNPLSFNLQKNKSQSYQFSLSGLKSTFKKDEKKRQYNYYKKIVDKGIPYYQFEKVNADQ